jgi:glycosyltransferase involved in cell wall biosynthesis
VTAGVERTVPVGATREADVLDVTVVIPIKNEATNLPDCFASLGSVRAVVVVDSASNDESRAIAEAAGATVVPFDWNGRFPKKRNWLLRTWSFDTDWVLFLDADERLNPDVRAEIASAIATPGGPVGYWLNYNNHFMGHVLRYGVPQRKLALFRIGAGEYERIDDERWSAFDMEIHEHPILDGPLGEIRARLEHKDYHGLHHFIARHNEYSTWEARRVAVLRTDPTGWSQLTDRQKIKYKNLDKWCFPYLYFILNFFIKLGFLDGRAGFFYSMFKFFYFFEIRAKIIDAQVCGRPPKV